MYDKNKIKSHKKNELHKQSTHFVIMVNVNNDIHMICVFETSQI